MKHSIVRADLTCRKEVVKDTGWRNDDLPPRYGPYPHTRPCPARWEWRCLIVDGGQGARFRMLLEVSPQLGKWKAMLIRDGETPVALMRFEDQPGSQGGLHIHANCDTNGDLTGAESIMMAYTLPDHGRRRRRRLSWTKAMFCRASSDFFRVNFPAEQEELPL